MNRTIKRTLLVVAIVAVPCVLVALIQLSRAKVETTTHGAPIRLLIPLLGKNSIAIPIYAGTGQRVLIPGFLDGPIVRRGENDAWSATWFCQDRAETARGNGETLQIDCAGQRHSFGLEAIDPPAAVAPMPDRIAVLSDLEGNIAFLNQALRSLKVVDASGNWHYGSGQLVIVGDSVDRGRDVFAVLWRLHALAGQAAASGGAVHVLLGNHEQYLLRTNPISANRNHLHALNTMGGYPEAFAADTVIGTWLRKQPVLVQLGPVVFAHAGISPAVARSGLSIEQINDAMKDYWNLSDTDQPDSAMLDAVLGPTGVTQYRGYFKAMDGVHDAASDADVDFALDRFDADRIVVGHTIVERIERLHSDRVYAIDVNSDESAAEALVFENGVARVVDIGVPRRLADPQGTSLRELEPGEATDRKLLADLYADIRRLSAQPYPY